MKIKRLVRPYRISVLLIILGTILCAQPATALETTSHAFTIFSLIASEPNSGTASTAPLNPDFQALEYGPDEALIYSATQTVLPSVVSMEEAVQWALNHNYDIQRQRFDVLAAEERVRQTGLLYSPTVVLNGRVSTMGPAETIHIPIQDHPLDIQVVTSHPIGTIGATVTQPVYTFGAIPLAREASSLGLQQARLQLNRGEQKLRNDVETAFLQAALTSSLADVAKKALDTSEERLRISNQRFDAGTVAKFEVLRSEVSVANARDQLIQAQTNAELAMSALVQKLGFPAETVIQISPPDVDLVQPEAPGFTLDEAEKTALQNRPDIGALELTVSLAGVNIDTQRNRPTIGLQGNYSLASEAVGFQQAMSWSLVLNMAFTVFDSGRSRTAMAEATAKRDSALAALKQTKSLVGLEVENAYRSLINTLDRIELARTTLASASEAVRIAKIGYTEGVTTYIDYQDADLSLRQAETLYLQAVYSYLIAESNLMTAIGGPIEPDSDTSTQ